LTNTLNAVHILEMVCTFWNKKFQYMVVRLNLQIIEAWKKH